MKVYKRLVVTLFFAGAMTLGAMPAQAGQLPSGCTKDKGTVTCTTFEGPGNNQAGVGTTTSNQTQGNTSNTSPGPQNLQSGSSCNPDSSQGKPCNP
jgi:hypothetical protein